MKDVVLMRSPYRKLLCDGESALSIDERVEHVGQEGNSWRSIWIRFWNVDAKLEHAGPIVAFVYKQHTEPH